jgi:hypothetical protein
MAAAIPQAAALDPEECRASARRRFPLEAMIDAYFARYAALAGG